MRSIKIQSTAVTYGAEPKTFVSFSVVEKSGIFDVTIGQLGITLPAEMDINDHAGITKVIAQHLVGTELEVPIEDSSAENT